MYKGYGPICFGCISEKDNYILLPCLTLLGCPDFVPLSLQHRLSFSLSLLKERFYKVQFGNSSVGIKYSVCDRRKTN